LVVQSGGDGGDLGKIAATFFIGLSYRCNRSRSLYLCLFSAYKRRPVKPHVIPSPCSRRGTSHRFVRHTSTLACAQFPVGGLPRRRFASLGMTTPGVRWNRFSSMRTRHAFVRRASREAKQYPHLSSVFLKEKIETQGCLIPRRPPRQRTLLSKSQRANENLLSIEQRGRSEKTEIPGRSESDRSLFGHRTKSSFGGEQSNIIRSLKFKCTL
jgi:hypothetical protein